MDKVGIDNAADMSSNLCSSGEVLKKGASSWSCVTALASTDIDTSAELLAIVTDETGTGALVFTNTPTLVTPILGAATGTSLVLSGDLTVNGDDIFMATNTSGAVLVADGTNFNPVVMSGHATIATDGVLSLADNSVSLATTTTGNYVADITAGNYLDVSGGTVENANITVTFDPTEIGTLTWGAAAASYVWTIDLTGTDDTITFGSNLITFGNPVSFTSAGSGVVTIGSAGVSITEDGDGSLTFLGLGNGNDENLIINFDDGVGGANSIEITSGTGATDIDTALNIRLEENASLKLDPAGSADGKFTGITVTGTAGAVLAFGDIVVLDVTDSRWELADANSAAAADGDSRGLLGICVLAAAGDGSATTILLHGIIRADTAFPVLTITAPVYVSETAGDIVVTQPVTADVVIRIVGSALTADEIYFDPSQDYTTHT